MKHLKYFLIAFSSMLLFSCNTDDSDTNNDPDDSLIIEIEEMPDVDTLLTSINAPSGDGVADFAILSESNEGAFNIDNSGNITVGINSYFNYESTQVLTAEIGATRGGANKVVLLTVNLIDYEEQYQRISDAIYCDSDFRARTINIENEKLTRYSRETGETIYGFELFYNANGDVSQVDFLIADDGFCRISHAFTFNANNRINSVTVQFNGICFVDSYTLTVEHEGNDIFFYDETEALVSKITLNEDGRVARRENYNGSVWNYDFLDGNFINQSLNYDTFKNPLADSIFHPLYESLLYTGKGSLGNRTFEEFRNANNILDVEEPANIYNKNDYPVKWYYHPEGLCYDVFY